MRTRTAFLVVAALFAASALISNLRAEPLVNIETVTVGDAGNAADTTGYGAVAYEFSIGKYEVTISQYTTFLNSVAAVTSASYIIDLWEPGMATDLNIAGISRNGSGTVADPFTYSVIGSGNRPISYVSWFDAARFANWVNNGATIGASTETGAYTLNGATSGIIQKNLDASWWIPNAQEWFKAAYYKSGGLSEGYWLYPTQSDLQPGNVVGAAPNQANYAPPPDFNFSTTQSSTYSSTENYITDVGSFSGSPSAYGTFDQGGNLWEWLDADGLVDPSWRGLGGGNWSSEEGDLQSSSFFFELPPEVTDNGGLGFRVATVPEPSTYALLLMTGAGALWWARRRR